MDLKDYAQKRELHNYNALIFCTLLFLKRIDMLPLETVVEYQPSSGTSSLTEVIEDEINNLIP